MPILTKCVADKIIRIQENGNVYNVTSTLQDGVLSGGSRYAGSCELIINFYAPIRLNEYKIATYLNETPSSWSVFGMDEEINWVLIGEVQDTAGWISGEFKTFQLNNKNKYSCYKISFTSSSGAYISLSQLEFYEIEYINKCFIFDNGTYKKYTDLGWEVVSSLPPTENDYIESGMDDISIIPENAWSELSGDFVEVSCYSEDASKNEIQIQVETDVFTLEEISNGSLKVVEYSDNPNQTESSIVLNIEPISIYEELGDTVEVLCYTDNSVNEVELNINANYSPLDEFDENFEVVTWSEADSVSLTMTALPKGQVVINTQKVDLYGDVKKILSEKIQTANTKGATRFLLSFDGGNTWESFKRGKWFVVNLLIERDVINNGMNHEDIESIYKEDFSVKIDENTDLRIAYYLDENFHLDQEAKIGATKMLTDAPINDVKFSDMAFYLLNTTATINVQFVGRKIIGELDDADKGKVRFRVILNNNPYFPTDGSFTSLLPSPVDINILIDDRKVLLGQQNTLKVEFEDYWGQTDYWETTFIGTHFGLMFMSEGGDYYSTSFGEVLKYLDFGQLIAGQTTLDQKVILKNQLGYEVQNVRIKAINPDSGIQVELSKEQSPFIALPELVYSDVLGVEEEIAFFVRLSSQITSEPTSNGRFQVRVNADKVPSSIQ